MRVEYQKLAIEEIDVYEIASCPFCGSSEIIIQDSVPFHSHAFCKLCGARGPTEYSTLGALEKWNERFGTWVCVDGSPVFIER